MAARNAKRSISMILRKNRGLWTVYRKTRSRASEKYLKQESPSSLFFPGVQIVERRRKIHEEKNEGRQLNSLPTDRHALLSERLDGTGYVGEPLSGWKTVGQLDIFSSNKK